ncbi:hypothetical protein JOC37_000657 [Desulfohalotomaculum tongense]|uniref:hypothetical protein n=1 Tax=Desulforadius tongensis TaxID=1216062 RepID=UPI001957A70C|nr:hypothetical protein [Desulforadius tongensis]MBM7854284.1 hypothetical protein [Desulforadius tongensis]
MKEYKKFAQEGLEELDFSELDVEELDFDGAGDDLVIDEKSTAAGQKSCMEMRSTAGKDRDHYKMLGQISKVLDDLAAADNCPGDHMVEDIDLPVQKDHKDWYINHGKREWDLVIDQFNEEKEREQELETVFDGLEDEKWEQRPETVLKTKSMGTLSAVLLAGGGALMLGLASVGVASLVKEHRAKKAARQEEAETEAKPVKTLPLETAPAPGSQPPVPEPVRPLQRPVLRPRIYHRNVG